MISPTPAPSTTAVTVTADPTQDLSTPQATARLSSACDGSTQSAAGCTPTQAITATPTSPDTPAPAPSSTLPPYLAPTALPGQPVILRTIKMINLSDGWAMDDTHILRTGDGGVTWVNAGPPIQEDGFLDAPYFYDTQLAWVANGTGCTSDGTCPGPVFVWRTLDGGQTWVMSSAVPPSSGEGGIDINGGPFFMQFFGAQTGLLITTTFQGMSSHGGDIFRTTDGGLHWRSFGAVGICSDYRGLVFVNQNSGVLADNCPAGGGLLYSGLSGTLDGGRTWSIMAAQEDCYAALSPAAAPPRTLFAFLACATANSIDLYVSSDGGRNWHPAELQLTDADPDLSLDFLNAQMGWLLEPGSGGVYQTQDGGRTWAEMATVTWRGWLNFVSPLNGWALAARPDKSGPGRPPFYNSDPVLLRTRDGGRTWEQLQPQLMP